MADNFIKFGCPNKACGKVYRVKHPGRAATVPFTCPACGRQFKINIPAPRPEAAPATAPAAPAAGGISVGVAHQAVAVPGAGLNPLAQQQAAAPRKQPYQGTIVKQYNDFGTVTPQSPASAVLRVSMHRFLLPAGEKDFTLNGYGSWSIGRKDAETPSAISITGDSSISRRSAEIEAMPSPEGTIYIFRVQKTRNPIYINGRPLLSGDAIQIRFGDRIKMGETNMQFIDK